MNAIPPSKSPFDRLRVARALAPHSARLNDRRWLVGEALRRVYERAYGDGEAQGQAPTLKSISAIPAAEIAAHARAKLAAAEKIAGPHAWPIIRHVIFDRRPVDECAGYVPETGSRPRAVAIVLDRLRCALDQLAELAGVKPSA